MLVLCISYQTLEIEEVYIVISLDEEAVELLSLSLAFLDFALDGLDLARHVQSALLCLHLSMLYPLCLRVLFIKGSAGMLAYLLQDAFAQLFFIILGIEHINHEIADILFNGNILVGNPVCICGEIFHLKRIFVNVDLDLHPLLSLIVN